MLGDYHVEIEDSCSGQIVMSISALRLIVMGRTLGEAEELARAALAFRWQDEGPRTELSGETRVDVTTKRTAPPPGAEHAA
jgi:hypothetical protein